MLSQILSGYSWRNANDIQRSWKVRLVSSRDSTRQIVVFWWLCCLCFARVQKQEFELTIQIGRTTNKSSCSQSLMMYWCTWNFSFLTFCFFLFNLRFFFFNVLFVTAVALLSVVLSVALRLDFFSSTWFTSPSRFLKTSRIRRGSSRRGIRAIQSC